MTLYLKIDQDENFEFFEKYDTLSPLRKKIWRKTVDCARKWVVARPSQSKIAEWCGCSRSAVSEAFKLFKEWGWLSLLSRGFKKSKTLLVPHSKRQIDVFNRQYFKRVEATHRATHTYPIYKNITSMGTGETLKIPLCIQKLNLERSVALKFALVDEVIVQDALRVAKSLGSGGWLPEKPGEYLSNIALKMAKNRGHHIDWAKYYRTLKVA